MIKAFISQPMRGLSDEEIVDKRNEAVEKLEELYYGVELEIIDNFFIKAPYYSKPLWFLGKSIQLLSDADVAYFVEGWQNARGCSIEHICAVEYGLNVIEEKNTYESIDESEESDVEDNEEESDKEDELTEA